MEHSPDEEIIAEVAPSTGRRFLGIGLLSFLAFLVLWVAIKTPPSMGWQIFLIALASISLIIANAMRKSTRRTLELTRSELRDSTGHVLVKMEDVLSVDRGAFAFKPSNGFLLRLSKPYPRAWYPGVWWRASTRIGVGGMTPMRTTKYMAEVIAIILAERDEKQPDDL
jgi:hypothetical protein